MDPFRSARCPFEGQSKRRFDNDIVASVKMVIDVMRTNDEEVYHDVETCCRIGIRLGTKVLPSKSPFSSTSLKHLTTSPSKAQTQTKQLYHNEILYYRCLPPLWLDRLQGCRSLPCPDQQRSPDPEEADYRRSRQRPQDLGGKSLSSPTSASSA